MSKIVLAYDGGLESSIILEWLQKRGDEVVCFVADVGQEDDVTAIEAQARRLGASDVHIADLQEELLTEFLFPALKANALYEGKCMLGAALATSLIAKYQIEAAVDEGTLNVCHGANGQGIEQIRFELAYKSLLPKVSVTSPWKDPTFVEQFSEPASLVEFASSQGIPLPSRSKEDYQTRSNLIQTSYSGGQLEQPHVEADEELYVRTSSPYTSPDTAAKLVISFEHGIPTAVEDLGSGSRIERALDLYSFLNEIAAHHGVGRADVVVNRLMGIKWREVYEAPAATVLWLAHRDLEGLVLDKQVLALKDQLTQQIGECLYNGLCFGPEMRLLMAAVEESQDNLTGKVTVVLYKGACRVVARESVLSRYCQTLNRMEQLDAFNVDDVRGFLNIQSLRLQQRASTY